MAKHRETPICPLCGEFTAKAVYKDQRNMSIEQQTIGDTFLHWEPIPHECKPLKYEGGPGSIPNVQHGQTSIDEEGFKKLSIKGDLERIYKYFIGQPLTLATKEALERSLENWVKTWNLEGLQYKVIVSDQSVYIEPIRRVDYFTIEGILN